MRSGRGAMWFVILAILGPPGCVTVDYVGRSYPPTANVDVYMSAADVKRPYETIGQARAEVDAMPFTNNARALQDKLVVEARSRGANGVILGDLDRRTVNQMTQTTGQATKHGKKKIDYTETSTTSSDELVELRGTLIRYTGQ